MLKKIDEQLMTLKNKWVDTPTPAQTIILLLGVECILVVVQFILPLSTTFWLIFGLNSGLIGVTLFIYWRHQTNLTEQHVGGLLTIFNLSLFLNYYTSIQNNWFGIYLLCIFAGFIFNLWAIGQLIHHHTILGLAFIDTTFLYWTHLVFFYSDFHFSFGVRLLILLWIVTFAMWFYYNNLVEQAELEEAQNLLLSLQARTDELLTERKRLHKEWLHLKQESEVLTRTLQIIENGGQDWVLLSGTQDFEYVFSNGLEAKMMNTQFHYMLAESYRADPDRMMIARGVVWRKPKLAHGQIKFTLFVDNIYKIKIESEKERVLLDDLNQNKEIVVIGRLLPKWNFYTQQQTVSIIAKHVVDADDIEVSIEELE